jgi:hypothetical protein
VSFMFIFTLEAMIKILAVGFACGHKAYLKESWNILDFIIVIAGLIEFTLNLL